MNNIIPQVIYIISTASWRVGKESDTDFYPLRSLPSPFAVGCCLKTLFLCVCSVRTGARTTTAEEENGPLLGFWEKGNRIAWFCSGCGFVATALTPCYFSLFPSTSVIHSRKLTQGGSELWVMLKPSCPQYASLQLGAKTRLLSGTEAVVFWKRNL